MRVTQLIPVFFLSGVVACGGGGGDSGGTNPPPPAAVASVSLSKTSASLKPNESTTITATPKDASGNALAGRTVTWSVSPTSGVASITPNGTSVSVTATANGQATVTATVEGKVGNATITVTNSFNPTADVAVGANGALAFDPSQADIAAGGTVTFTFNALHNVTWGGSNPASLPNSGDKSSGTFQVTIAQAGTYNYQCTLHPGMNGTITVH